MKGLTLSEQYYRRHGAGMIATNFPTYESRIAVGLAGLGSECFGFDDAYSRDHDWGPGFCIWLEKSDFDRIGASLQQAYESLPDQFMGFQRKKSAWGDGRIGVMSSSNFYASFMGIPHAPDTVEKWLTIPEANLAACTNGKVFSDPLGAFSAVRQKIRNYYPEDVRLKKIAAKCMTAAQSGQYNYARCLQRGAIYPAFQSLIKFCEDALALVFLLNRRYMPFYKWAVNTALCLPMLGNDIAPAVEELIKDASPLSRTERIEKICTAIIETLKAQGLSSANSDFLLDHGPGVHSLIRDETIKRYDIWWAGS